jgi:Ser/Thr protein kinase RdoA (MazF antagonist)
MPSRNGSLLEIILAEGMDFRIASFVKGQGLRVPDNGYRYREEAPIEEYFQNWGQVLGQMHALARDYEPDSERVRRPAWFELRGKILQRVNQMPPHLDIVRTRIQATLDEIRSLPKTDDSFGLIHGDFNDGNFTVNYNNGDITVFDFDDSCYFWYVYELATAWEGGIGRVMFCDLEERKAFMAHYMDQVMEGYNREYSLSDEWLERLPLFLKLIQIEEFLHYVQYIADPDEETGTGLNYKIKCIEEEIPYMGFFDRIYAPERPFSLV